MRLALVGGTIYASPADAPLRDGVVLVEGSKISAVDRRDVVRPSAQDTIVDCSGCAVMAGFWNSHVHFFERKWANAAAIGDGELQRQLHQTYARYGFTTVFDLGSMWQNTREIRNRVESGAVAGPNILSTGEALVPPGALPAPPILAALGYAAFPAPEISDASQASEAASRLLAAGTDGIKIFPSSPRGGSIPDDAIAAAAAIFRSAGKPAFAHPDSAQDVLAAIRAGVNVIAHTTPRSGRWDEPMIFEMKQRAVAVTPTLMLWQSLLRHDRISLVEQLTQGAVDQLRCWHDAGGTVLFGTDAGAADADPAQEFALMAQAGMGFADILASLTTIPAQLFGFSGQRGRIAAGFDADLTVVAGDPANDPGALARVRGVIQRGDWIPPE